MGISFYYGVLALISFIFGVALVPIRVLKKDRSINYLSAVYFLRIFYLLPIAIVVYGYDISWSTWTTGPVRVSIVPLLYLYVSKLFKEDKTFKKADLRHFVPTLLDSILTIVVAINHALDVVNNGDFDVNKAMQTIWEGNFYYILLSTVGRSIIFLQWVFYFFKLVPLLKKAIQFRKQTHSEQNQAYLQWLTVLIYSFMLWGFLDGIAIFGAYSISVIMQIVTFFTVVFSVYTYLFALKFAGEQSLIFPDSLEESANEIYEVGLGQYAGWEDVFFEKKLFLISDLTLLVTAQCLDIPRYRLTRLIREAGYDSFYHFVNTARINHSKQLLLAMPDTFVIESVITDCGFKSRSTFFRVFKEISGETPGKFLNNSHNCQSCNQ